MTFDEWLQSLGVRIFTPEDGPKRYIAPDGTVYTKDSPEYDQFYQIWQSQQTDATGQNIYGTAGAPDDRTTTFMGQDGRTYTRVGDPSQLNPAGFEGGYTAADVQYDPTYGWYMPQDALHQESFGEKFQSMLPVFQAASLFAGPVLQNAGLAFQGATNSLSAFPDVADLSRMGLDQFGNMAGNVTDFSGATFGNAPGIGDGSIMNVADDAAQGAIDMGVGGSGLSETLAEIGDYGITPNQVSEFVMQNLDNPQLISDMASQLGMTVEDIAQIFGMPADQVAQYFTSAGAALPGANLPGGNLLGNNIMGPLQTGAAVATAGTGIANAAGDTPTYEGEAVPDGGGGGNGYTPPTGDPNTRPIPYGDLTTNPDGTVNIPGLGNVPKWLVQAIPALLGGGLGAAATPGDYTQTTTSTTDVPERYRPYMDALINAAVPYFGQYVGTSPDEDQAMQMIRDQVAAGNPMMDSANANMEATLRGDYLNAGGASPIQDYLTERFGNYQTPDLQYLRNTAEGGNLNSPIQDYLVNEFANYQTPDLEYLRNTAEGDYLNAGPTNDWLTQQMNNYQVADTQGLRDTASGMYLSPESNPWLQDTYDRAARRVADQYTNTTQPRTDAMFNSAGAFGPSNSAYAEIVARNQYGLGENLSGLATDIYGGNYQTERNRQLAAQGQLPQLDLAAQSARMGAATQLGRNWSQERARQEAAGMALPMYGNQAANVRLNAASQYGQNWNQERARQEAAGMALPMYGNQAANIQLGAAGQYGQNYNAERQRQQTASALAPTLSQSRFDDAMQLYNLGNMWRQPTMNTFNWGSGLLRGTGSQSTQSTPQYSNPMAGILGGMFVGSQFGKSLFGS